MSKVSITRSLLDDLAMSISAKSGEAVPMTLTEMKDAVDSIQGGGTTIDPLSVTANGTYTAQSGHAYSPVTVSVPIPTPSLQTITKTYTPTETAQTETVSADSGYDGLDTVSISVGAISSTYVGSGITRRSSSDLTASGATITVPSGYYSAQASKSVANGTDGTPTATKGSVSNHQVSVTPSVTNTTGYITGSTKTGTAVTVSASELVSGDLSITANGSNIDVANYATATVAVSGASTKTNTMTKNNSDATATSLSFTNLKGEPKMFSVRLTNQLTRSSSYSYYYITAIISNTATTKGNYWRMSNGTFYNDTTHYSYTYSNGTLTVSSSAGRGSAGGSFYNGTYELVYIYLG